MYKIFRLLPLSIHNIFCINFALKVVESSIPIERSTRSLKVQVVQGSTSILKTGNIIAITITLNLVLKKSINNDIMIIITILITIIIIIIMTITIKSNSKK